MSLVGKCVLGFDIRRDRLEEASSQLGFEALHNLDDAWRYSVKAVLITTPPSSHVSLALQIAERRCPLFIEKPLSDRLDNRVATLMKVVKKKNLVTLVGCNMRFHPGIVKVRKLLEQRAIGNIIAARVEAGQYLPDWHPWENYRHTYSASRRLGGGIILDAIHEIDYIRWMLGEIKSIVCFAGKLSRLEIETEDTAAILLRFVNGAIGEVHLDYVQRTYSRTCQIIGEEGTVRWDYATGKVRWYSTATRKWKTFSNPPRWNPNQMYLDEMKHFLRCLSGRDRSTLDVFEASRVLEVATAAKRSARTGKVVELA